MNESEVNVLEAMSARRECAVKLHAHDAVIVSRSLNELSEANIEVNLEELNTVYGEFTEQHQNLISAFSKEEIGSEEAYFRKMQRIYTKVSRAYRRRVEHLQRERLLEVFELEEPNNGLQVAIIQLERIEQSNAQPQPTEQNEGQQGPKKMIEQNNGQARPREQNKGQARPMEQNNGQPRPMEQKNVQRRPNVGIEQNNDRQRSEQRGPPRPIEQKKVQRRPNVGIEQNNDRQGSEQRGPPRPPSPHGPEQTSKSHNRRERSRSPIQRRVGERNRSPTWQRMVERNDAPSHNGINREANDLRGRLERGVHRVQRIPYHERFPHVNRTRRLQCNYCSEEHPMFACAMFLQLTREQRRVEVQNLQLCANCLMPEIHEGITHRCRAGACRRCGPDVRHNSVLCDKGHY